MKISRKKKAAFALAAVVLMVGLTELIPGLLGFSGGIDLDIALPITKVSPDISAARLKFFEEDGPFYRTSQGTLDGPGYDQGEKTGPGLQRFAQVKPPGVIRIAFLGGSTTYGFLARQGYVEIIGERLRQVGRRRVQVLNAGLISTPSGDNLQRLPEILHFFQPDIVVLHTAHNEVLLVPQPYMIERARHAPARLLLDLLHRSTLYTYLWQRYLQLPHKVQAAHKLNTFQTPYFVKSPENAAIIQRAQERLAHHLGSMKELIKRAGARLVLVKGIYAPSMVESTRRWGFFCYEHGTSWGNIQRHEALFKTLWKTLASRDTGRIQRQLEQVEERGHGLYWGYLGRLLELQGNYQAATDAYERSLDLSWRPIGNAMNPIIMKFARQYKIPLADPEPSFRRQGRGKLLNHDLFVRGDFMHPNREGHAKIAETIIEVLRNERLIPTPGGGWEGMTPQGER